MNATAQQVIRTLGLAPHPEGGFYRETYRAAEGVSTSRGTRAAATAILFLVTARERSHLHRLRSDEFWIFQGGLPLELVTIAPSGELTRRVVGLPVGVGEQAPQAPACDPQPQAPARDPQPQVLVPAGRWMGARLAAGPDCDPPDEDAWGLVSCVVAPGFSFSDFELGERAALTRTYPQHAALIEEFTSA